MSNRRRHADLRHQPPPPVRPLSGRWDTILVLVYAAIIGALFWRWRHTIFLFGGAALVLGGWLWLCQRYPLVAGFTFGFDARAVRPALKPCVFARPALPESLLRAGGGAVAVTPSPRIASRAAPHRHFP